MRNILMRATLLAFALTACAHEPQIVNSICPPIPPYTMEQQTKAAAELRALPADSEIANFVTDYGALRARLRAAGCK